MKNCIKCSKNVPSSIVINGKRRNLKSRKYCLDCSPFGLHNTRALLDLKLTCITCDNTLSGNQTKYCSDACAPSDSAQCYRSQKRRAYDRKMTFVLEKGGACEVCGYNRNLSVLSFHHKIPSEKKFELDCRKISNTKMVDLRAEVAKCQLLCLNCHAELHNPDFFI